MSAQVHDRSSVAVMSDLLSRVVNEFGDLVAVLGARSEPAIPAQPTVFEQYSFRFDRGTLTVAADGSDDSVRLIEGETTLPHRAPLTLVEPWSGAVGRGVLWAWLLTNQSGFVDGFQIEFGWGSGTPNGNLGIQLVCEASALTAAMVRELDGQFHPEG